MASRPPGGGPAAAGPRRPDLGRPGRRPGQRGGRRPVGPARRRSAGRCSGRRCGSACCSPTLVLALAWIKQAPCADGDWTGSVQYTHFCYSDTVPLFGLHGLDTGAHALPGLPRRVPGAHRRLHGRWPPPSAGSTTALAAAVGPAAGRPARAELLRRDLPAAVAVRAADGPGGAGAVRPPAVGRGDGRAVAAAVRARLHQLGPVRGRAGHARHVGLGAAPAGRSPACCSGWAIAAKLYPLLLLGRAVPAVPAGRAAAHLAADGGGRGGRLGWS